MICICQIFFCAAYSRTCFLYRVTFSSNIVRFDILYGTLSKYRKLKYRKSIYRKSKYRKSKYRNQNTENQNTENQYTENQNTENHNTEINSPKSKHRRSKYRNFLIWLKLTLTHRNLLKYKFEITKISFRTISHF